VSAAAWFQRARSFLAEDVWNARPQRRALRSLTNFLQFSIMVVEGFVRDRLLLRASALAYFTVLSVIPLLAVAVSILGALGIGTESFINWAVQTFAAGSPETQTDIVLLVAAVDFASLGATGAALLFVTTVLSIGNVEMALNSIWGVKENRSWKRRLPDYLAVLVVGPLLGGIALSLSTSLHSAWALDRMLQVPGFAALYNLGLRQLPTVILCAAFAFLYAFIPNTKVRAISAIIGGVVAGVLVVGAQRAYLDLSVGVARANLFFGSFAALPLLFAWIYVLWAVVLFGAEIAFAHQNLALYRREVRGAAASAAEREAVALRIAIEVAKRFRDGAPPVETGELSEALDVPVRTVREVVDRLRQAGILNLQLRTPDAVEALQLGRPAERITVFRLLTALRGEREPAGGDAQVAELVDRVLHELDSSCERASGGHTLAELLEMLPAPARVDRGSGAR
jgi:membrane protein